MKKEKQEIKAKKFSTIELKEGKVYLNKIPIKGIQEINIKTNISDYPYAIVDLKLSCLLK